MKKSIFGGYDRLETERLLAEMEEKTGAASVRAAELENELEESRRKLREQAACAEENLRQKAQELLLEKEMVRALQREKEELESTIRKLQYTVADYERKISKVGQIYMTAYDEAERITSEAKEAARTAAERFAGTVEDANHTMKKQLGYLMLAKESIKETIASANDVIQNSFRVFAEKSLEIDQALLDVDSLSKQVKESAGKAFEGVHRAMDDSETAGQKQETTDFIDMIQNQVREPDSI